MYKNFRGDQRYFQKAALDLHGILGMNTWFLPLVFLMTTFGTAALAKAPDFHAVDGIPTAGPNCFFAAVTINRLLELPAIPINDEAMDLLFFNPNLCETVQTPVEGDIGLEIHGKLIWHAFTYLTPNRRFEKAGPDNVDLFHFVEMAATSATQFVRCRPMQAWVNSARSTLPPSLGAINQTVDESERLLDSRNATGKDPAQVYPVLRQKILGLGDAQALITKELSVLLAVHGIADVPVVANYDVQPIVEGGQFYSFARAHPELLNDPKIFATMWLSARLATLTSISINYKALRDLIHMLP